jgi:hypothetical protein
MEIRCWFLCELRQFCKCSGVLWHPVALTTYTLHKDAARVTFPLQLEYSIRLAILLVGLFFLWLLFVWCGISFRSRDSDSLSWSPTHHDYSWYLHTWKTIPNGISCFGPMLFVFSHAVKRVPTLLRLWSIFLVFRMVRLFLELNLLLLLCGVISRFSSYSCHGFLIRRIRFKGHTNVVRLKATG